MEERSARQRELANKVVALLGAEVPSAGIDRDDEIAEEQHRLAMRKLQRESLELGTRAAVTQGTADLEEAIARNRQGRDG